jgi:LysM repeat protein
MSSITDALGWLAGAFYVIVALSIVYLFFFRIVPLVLGKITWDIWSLVRGVLVLGVLAFLLGCVAIFTADWIFSQVLDTLPRTRMAREVDRVTGSLMRLSVDSGPYTASAGPVFGMLNAPEAPSGDPQAGYTAPPPGSTAPVVDPLENLKPNALDLWATLVQTKYNPSGNVADNTNVMNKRDIPQGVTCDVAAVGGGWKLKRYEEWRLACSMDNFRSSVVIQVNGTAARGLTGGSYYTAENPFTVYGTGQWPDIAYLPANSNPAQDEEPSGEPQGGPASQDIPTVPVREHQVRPGESLAMIAQKYSLSVPKLVQANQNKYPQLQANPNVIVVGWVLEIPSEE